MLKPLLWLRPGRLLLASLWIAMAAIAVVACTNPDDDKKNVTKDPVDPGKLGLVGLCPGAENCLSNDGDIHAGMAKVSISPENYEVANWAYLVQKGFCPAPTPKQPSGVWRCGHFVDKAMNDRKDCGTDGICPDDNLKTKISCDDKTPCPGNGALTCNTKEKRCYQKYKGPDADGSEKDGKPDWFLDCGKDRICPCLNTDKKPAYYGADGKCLKGHSKNPAYKGPDADGTEGNGKFDGIWMGGFDNNHPLQGKHDDVWSRALVMKTGDTTVAIVSIDAVGYFFSEIKKVRAKVKEMLKDKDIDYILVSSTHTHEAADTMGQWGPAPNNIPIATGFDAGLRKAMIENIAQSIVNAHKSMKKASIFVASTKTKREGLICDSRDPKIFDLDMGVMKIVEKDSGKVIGSLINWGNHPEVLSDINNFLSSDFSHYLREAMEKGVPKGKANKAYAGLGGINIYLQGAVGCLMTPLRVTAVDLQGNPQNKSNWDKAKAIGDQLAVTAFTALENATELKGAKLSFWAKELYIPVENRVFHVAFNGKLLDRETFKYDKNEPLGPQNVPSAQTEIVLITLGDLTFFSLPGEVAPELLIGVDPKYSYGLPAIDKDNSNPPDLSLSKGPYLKEKIPGKFKFFVGLGNDELGYLVPTWDYKLGTPPYFSQAKGDHYEETNSLGPKAVPELMKGWDAILKVYKEQTKK